MSHKSNGVSEHISSLVEFPLSKKNINWKVNTGLRLAHKSFMLPVSVVGTDANISATMSNHLLMLEIPVVFSYDFVCNNNNALRLGFGLFYTRYLVGAKMIDGQNVGIPVAKAKSDIYQSPNNVGLNIGLSYWIGDFNIGLEYESIFDWIYRSNSAWNMFSNFSGTIGYRF